MLQRLFRKRLLVLSCCAIAPLQQAAIAEEGIFIQSPSTGKAQGGSEVATSRQGPRGRSDPTHSGRHNL